MEGGGEAAANTNLVVGTSLIKQLAATDTKTRTRTLKSILNTWLPSQTQVPDDLMKKLWKGLFYCVWHSDKVPAQTHLINCLSSLLPQLPLGLSVHFFSVFLLTMRREWSGIDRLRLDKFYLLIRKFLNGWFLLMKKNSWDVEICRRLMSVLVEGTFLAGDKFQGGGVNYHVASVFLEELRGFMPLKKEVVEVLLSGLISVMGTVQDKIFLSKIKSCVFDELLRNGKALLGMKKAKADGSDGNSDVVVWGSVALVLVFSPKLYALGSAEECLQGNRKVILGLHEEFLRLEKELEASGLEVIIPELSEEDEIPTLVPVASALDFDGCGGNVTSGGVQLKKCKKLKTRDQGSDVKGNKNKKKKEKHKNSNGNGIASEINVDGSSFEGDNVANGTSLDVEKSGEEMVFTESVISNLQRQFEKVASEAGMDKEVSASPTGVVSKKRKRMKSVEEQKSKDTETVGKTETEDVATAKSVEKSAKKVRFSMKNNLVWKPHSPLPPQNVRIPPSLTPRGSALKKGIAPGPIREISPATKKVKKGAKTLKKGLKQKNAAKRPKKLKLVTS